MNFFINSAYGAEAGGPTSDAFSYLLPIGFLVIFYFILWRPQSKRTKEHKSLMESITKGDEVLTNGGLMGKIIKVDETYVVIEVAEKVELKMQKSSMAAILPKGTIKSI